MLNKIIALNPFNPQNIVTNLLADANCISDQVRIPIYYCSNKEYEWFRDPRVVLPNGTHLIPYAFKDNSYKQKLVYLCGKTAQHLLYLNEDPSGNEHALTGNGFDTQIRKEAIQHAQKQNIPYLESKVCIEGGNCRFFQNKQGEPACIIGLHSLWLSYLALKEENLLKSKYSKQEEQGSIETLLYSNNPDINFQTACTLILYLKLLNINQNREVTLQKMEIESIASQVIKNHIAKNYPENAFKQNADPLKLSDADLKNAFKLKKDIEFTKKYIASELGIAIEDLIITPQSQFHIDMMLFQDAAGTVYLQDDQKCLELLHNLAKEHPDSAVDLELDYYIHTANENITNYGFQLNQIEQSLQNQGLQVKRVPGAFGNKESNPFCLINFFNGFHVSEPDGVVFVTTGVDQKQKLKMLIENAYTNYLQKCSIQLKEIRYLNSLETINYLSRGGGYNCRIYPGYENITPESLFKIMGTQGVNWEKLTPDEFLNYLN